MVLPNYLAAPYTLVRPQARQSHTVCPRGKALIQHVTPVLLHAFILPISCIPQTRSPSFPVSHLPIYLWIPLFILVPSQASKKTMFSLTNCLRVVARTVSRPNPASLATRWVSNNAVVRNNNGSFNRTPNDDLAKTVTDIEESAGVVPQGNQSKGAHAFHNLRHASRLMIFSTIAFSQGQPKRSKNPRYLSDSSKLAGYGFCFTSPAFRSCPYSIHSPRLSSTSAALAVSIVMNTTHNVKNHGSSGLALRSRAAQIRFTDWASTHWTRQ